MKLPLRTVLFYPHCCAIASAMPGKVFERSFFLRALFLFFSVPAFLDVPDSIHVSHSVRMFVADKSGNPFSHR